MHTSCRSMCLTFTQIFHCGFGTCPETNIGNFIINYVPKYNFKHIRDFRKQLEVRSFIVYNLLFSCLGTCSFFSSLLLVFIIIILLIFYAKLPNISWFKLLKSFFQGNFRLLSFFGLICLLQCQKRQKNRFATITRTGSVKTVITSKLSKQNNCLTML